MSEDIEGGLFDEEAVEVDEFSVEDCGIFRALLFGVIRLNSCIFWKYWKEHPSHLWFL